MQNENFAILALVAIVAFLAGQSMAQAKTPKPGASSADQAQDAPASMDWFVTWSGLK